MSITKERATEICKMIAADAEADVARYEGMPLDGKTIAAYQSEQNAMIQALANVVAELAAVVLR